MFGINRTSAKKEVHIVDENVVPDESSENVDFKNIILQRYLSKVQFVSQQDLERAALKQNAFIFALYSGAFVFCLLGVMNIWTKNSNVGVHIQRIDGVRIEIVNDARSKILLRKAIQNGLTREEIAELDLE